MLRYSKGLNKSGIVFCEACGVRPVDEQYPAPPCFLSTLELHGLFFFQHHSVIEVLRPVLLMAAGLSSAMAFQIGWQKPRGTISGDPGRASQIQGPFMIRFCHIQAFQQKQTILYKPPNRSHPHHKPAYLHSAPASRPRCLWPHLISHGLLIRLKWLQYWLCGRGFQPCPQCGARRHCLPFFTDVEESISSFADSVGRG